MSTVPTRLAARLTHVVSERILFSSRASLSRASVDLCFDPRIDRAPTRRRLDFSHACREDTLICGFVTAAKSSSFFVREGGEIMGSGLIGTWLRTKGTSLHDCITKEGLEIHPVIYQRETEKVKGCKSSMSVMFYCIVAIDVSHSARRIANSSYEGTSYDVRGQPMRMAPLPLAVLTYRGDRSTELMATRKPRSPIRNDGYSPLRNADRQTPAGLTQPPPRRTLAEPVAGPVGSLCVVEAYLPYQSEHHSHTLPCISYNPQAFGDFWPTGCSMPPELGENQACPCNAASSSIPYQRVVVPARDAYSHCASLAK